MPLPFLDRERELDRLRTALARRDGALVCLYGRRRLGKSRLLRVLLEKRPAVYYVGDERDGTVQRNDLAREMNRILPGFAAVTYPGWMALLERWWREAPVGAALALDEFPSLVRASPELPSLLQKLVDQPPGHARKVVLCGSSQRMMHGLLLDGGAPLYGRAREIVRLEPLDPVWVRRAFRVRNAALAVERYALWGGVPRYWELAVEFRNSWDAVEALVLDPLGVLHREPERLLSDEIDQLSRAASLLAVIGQGCHRISEIAARLQMPSTSLARPMALLVDLGFVRRDVPFGAPLKDSKRSLYRIQDPLLEFFNVFVEPNRSRLGAGHIQAVRREIEGRWSHFLGGRWEQMVRDRIGQRPVLGTTWLPSSRFWGKGSEGKPFEIDAIATAADDSNRVLVVEAKLAVRSREVPGLLAGLRAKAAACPALSGKRVEAAIWALRHRGVVDRSRVLDAEDLLVS